MTTISERGVCPSQRPVSSMAYRLAVQVFDARSSRVLWSRVYDRDLTPAALIAVQDDLAAWIATEIGQPYGAITDDLHTRTSSPEVLSMQSYVCVLRAHVYRRSFARAEFQPVMECLEDAVRRDADYADALAMLGYAYMYAGVFRYGDDVEPDDYYARAVEAAFRAMTLEPNNTLALKVLSATNHYLGNFGESERFARLALERNPYDPDALVQLGWRLAIRGDFDEGVPLIERAILRSANPPGWYFHLLAVDRLMHGDGPGMLVAAQSATADGSPLSQSFVAMAYGLLGDDGAATYALRRMNEMSPGYDPIAAYRTHRATEEILEAFAAALDRAGWDAP